MSILLDPMSPPCTHEPEIYEHLNATLSRSDSTPAEWDQLNAARAIAHRQCAGCPLMVECLYRAVVEVDVSGFAACTTETDRQLIRRQLGIEIKQPTTGQYGAPRVGGGPVSHEAVMTVRQAYPKDTCHQLAERLGCSTSTVKRHLRRAREQQRDEAAATESSTTNLPSVDAVLDCFDRLETSQVA